ncbi:MAG TPA: hypothetical protein VLH15_11480 [Dehalococcoidales bacterium]|nr:hypothetical protein [Dehalococcoidales bacterium]
MWWAAADIVLAFHILLFLLLGIGIILAATGNMHRKLALFFWPVLFFTALNMPLPGCILTDIERWLRHMVMPGWNREMSLARTVSGAVTGWHPPDLFFTIIGLLLFALAIYAFVRFHLKDVLQWFRRSGR